MFETDGSCKPNFTKRFSAMHAISLAEVVIKRLEKKRIENQIELLVLVTVWFQVQLTINLTNGRMVTKFSSLSYDVSNLLLIAKNHAITG